MQWYRGATGVARAGLPYSDWRRQTSLRRFASRPQALNWEASYDSAKLSQLLADRLLFRLSKSKWLVDAVRTCYQSKSLPWLVDPILAAVFDRFCGGETYASCILAARRLNDEHRVKAILDHCTEELHSPSSMDASARNKIQLIERIHADLAGKVQFIPLKLTSLVHPRALEAATEELRRDPTLVHSAQPSAIPVPHELQQQLSRGLDRLREVAACARKTEGSVSLLLDAEQSHRQPAVHWLYSLLAREFNQLAASRHPLLYNTYQCYLATTPEVLERDLAFSIQHELAFGVKLVRGAYLSSEQQYAKDLRIASPLHHSKLATDQCYHDMSHRLLLAIAASLSSPTSLLVDGNDPPLSAKGMALPHQPWLSVMFATHSRSSLSDILRFMRDLNQQVSQTNASAGAFPHPMGIFHRRVCFAQIKGICDHLTEALGHAGYDAHKLILFGDLAEIAPWLFRRLDEHRDGLGALAEEQQHIRSYIQERLALRRLFSTK